MSEIGTSTTEHAPATTMSSLDTILGDIEGLTENLPASALRPNPVVEVGKINTYEDFYPRWSSNTTDDLFELPSELIEVKSALDMTKAEIVLTRMSFYEQRKQDYIAAGGDLETATEGDLNTQAEIDLALPGAVFGYVAEDGTFVPHPMYNKPQLSRMRARALVAYTKTRFNADPTLITAVRERLEENGFEHVVNERERMGEMKRRMLFNIQAPLRGNPSSIQMRLRQQQETGFRLRSFTLVAPRPIENRYSDATGGTRPEFEGFAYHLADNIRWATILTADNVDGLAAFSLTTALTGIDHRSQDDTRPMGNALRATIQSIAWDNQIPDATIRKTLGLPDTMPVTPQIRQLVGSSLGVGPETIEINFFGTAAAVAVEA